ncbi:MAG TPA: ATP phosphoribosyltransferase regulatory subunit [Azospirillaceae bacterium]|nr:ATP phosphoribosyltransferase regulatory subunit [Azospirillaceae bacterium]
MTDLPSKALLPAGLSDLLPPDAAHEAAVVERVMAAFAAHGYDRVKPPLIEFEDALLSGPGAAIATQTFRLMDPVSRRMLAVRPDITLQVARIALSRLAKAPRPLRLAYAGQVLRVEGSHLRPDRQFGQVGVELIGSLAASADAEVILLAAGTLERLGICNLSVDLCVPTLVPAVCRALDLPAAETKRLRQALDRKDAAAVAAVGGPAAELASALMAASGPAAGTVETLSKLDLPAEAEADRRRLTEVVRLVGEAAPHLMLTADPVEHRGWEYQTGLSFTLLARGVRGELGAGGRYRAGALDGAGDGAGEPATGFTLYTDVLLRALPAPEAPRRLFLPHGTPAAVADRLRGEGWAAVAALEPSADPVAEARRLGCTHLFRDGHPHAV